MGADAPPSIKSCPYFIEGQRKKKLKRVATVLEIREKSGK